MTDHAVVSHEEWLEARKALLAQEKELMRARDALSAKRRALPWTKVEKAYRFQGPEGALSLSDLFGPHRQLIVQHFMFAPEWEKPCKSCSFWADGYNGIVAHLAHRDTAFVAVSRAPVEKLEARKRKMGWTFPWVSSGGSDFSYDFDVSFRDGQADGASYNYRPKQGAMTDLPGISAFVKDDGGAIYHTYSCFARGLDPMNPAYAYLDLTARGRHEDGLPNPMSWVKLRDEYAAP
ncbi:MAG: DUF899 domain-containing protein [Hyphomicrobiales bacterium]|nr:DUF899 domain-containing protein [Hyphomicrobiales bacterium]